MRKIKHRKKLVVSISPPKYAKAPKCKVTKKGIKYLYMIEFSKSHFQACGPDREEDDGAP